MGWLRPSCLLLSNRVIRFVLAIAGANWTLLLFSQYFAYEVEVIKVADGIEVTVTLAFLPSDVGMVSRLQKSPLLLATTSTKNDVDRQ